MRSKLVSRAVPFVMVLAIAASACGDDKSASPATTSGASTGTTVPGGAATTASAPATTVAKLGAGGKVMVIGDETSTITFKVPEAVPAVQGGLKDTALTVEHCDSKGDANAAQACERKAIDDGVVAVVSSFGSLGADQSLLTKAGIPVVGTADPTAPTAYALGSSSYAALGIGVGKIGCKRVASLNAEGTDALADTIKAGVMSQGGVEVARTFVPFTAPDLAPAVAKLLAADPDCIVLSLAPNGVVQAMTALSQTGKTPKVAAVGAIFPKAIRDTLGPLANGVYTAEIQVNPDDPDPVINTIKTDMQAFDKSAQVTTLAILSWSSAQLIAAALKDVQGPLTPASMKTALDGLRDVDMQGAIHAVSTEELKNPAYKRSFNNWGLMYKIDNGTPVRQGDFFDLSPITNP